jgi:hypothetical protein
MTTQTSRSRIADQMPTSKRARVGPSQIIPNHVGIAGAIGSCAIPGPGIWGEDRRFIANLSVAGMAVAGSTAQLPVGSPPARSRPRVALAVPI